jgi:hypothetical protein
MPVANGGNAANQKPLVPLPELPEMTKDRKRWIRRAAQGGKTALRALRQLLNRPKCVNRFNDMAARFRGGPSRKFAGCDLLTKELLDRKLNRVRAELPGSERMFINHRSGASQSRPAVQVNVGG